MDKPLRILHLEDEPGFWDLASALLEKDGLVAEMVPAGDLKGFIGALETGGFDLILADYSLPDCTGMTLYGRCATVVPAPPSCYSPAPWARRPRSTR